MKIFISCSIFMFFLASCNVFELEDKQEKYNGVEVAMAKQDNDLFTIKRILEKELNSGVKGKNLYRLVISKTKTLANSGLSSAAFSSNINVTIVIFYSLYEISTGKLILKSSVMEQDSYLAAPEKLVSEFMDERGLSANISEKLAKSIMKNLNRI